MIGEGSYFLNCLIYIHLNMVRAGVVSHPMEWRWRGHDELVGKRVRYRLIDQEALRCLLGPGLQEEFEQTYRSRIEDAIAQRRLDREPWWTKSIAVGDKEFVERVKAQTRYRRRLDTSEAADGVWVVRETLTTYGGRVDASPFP